MKPHLYSAILSLLLLLAAGLASAQTHDNFATPLVIGEMERVTHSNLNCTAQLGEPTHGSWQSTATRSLWYKFTPAANGFYTVDASGSLSTADVAIYRGTALTTLVLLQKGEDSLKVELVKGIPYYIAVDSAAATVVEAIVTPLLVFPVAQSFEALLPSSSGLNMALEPWDYGKMIVTTTTAGSFSGRLYLGATSYALAGRFHPSGTTIDVPRVGLPTLRLMLDATQTVAGIAVSGLFVPDVSKHPQRTINFRPRMAPGAVVGGRFSVIDWLRQVNNTPMALGHGQLVGSVAISATGIVTGSIYLPDGAVSTFSVPTLLTTAVQRPLTYECLVHQVLYAGGGQLTARLTWDRDGGVNDGGEAMWFRTKVDTRRKLHHRGTRSEHAWLGMTQYTPPARGVRYWAADSAAGTGDLYYTSMDHATSWTFPVALSTLNVMTAPAAPLISSVSIVTVPSTGLVYGSFRQGPINGVYYPISFKGYYVPGYGKVFAVQEEAAGSTFLIIDPH